MKADQERPPSHELLGARRTQNVICQVRRRSGSWAPRAEAAGRRPEGTDFWFSGGDVSIYFTHSLVTVVT